MVTYVADISRWEDWQRDYRLGLILIMPPAEVSRQIDPLRAKYDPYSHAICPTHISLSDPLRREMTPELAQEIQNILHKIEPFMLYYDKPQASTQRAGVAYPVTPQKPIDDLKEALHTATIFEETMYQRRHIPAHITIAEFISIEDGLTLCAELADSAPSGSFLCDRLEFVVPDADFHFQRRGTFFLGTLDTNGSLFQQEMERDR
jgi:hypothetical protein